MVEKNIQIKQKFKEQKCCVIVPTYNNTGTIVTVLNDLLSYCEDVLIVNDGSTDDTSVKIEPFKNRVTLIEYPKNKGKGYALQAGFRVAVEKGYRYAITIDSDGQHFAKDLNVFLNAVEYNPHAVIIGARKMNPEDQSKGSRFANKFSNFWFTIETGESPEDTQSGYRLYPLEPISCMKFFTKKYEFEIESIVRLNWRGYMVLTVPIDVYYPPRNERVSHFRPGKDFIRISILNTVLVALALLFFLPRNMLRKFRKKNLNDIFRENIMGGTTSTEVAAFSVGYGVFWGIAPIWGYQLIVGLSIAHLLKLNKGIVFLAANISIPPMIPVILYFSYVLGGYILGYDPWKIHIGDITFETVKSDIVQYVVGAVFLAILAGVTMGLLSYVIIKFMRLRKEK